MEQDYGYNEGDPWKDSPHPSLLEEPDSGDRPNDIRQDRGAAGHQEGGHEFHVQEVKGREAQEDHDDQEHERISRGAGLAIHLGECRRKTPSRAAA